MADLKVIIKGKGTDFTKDPEKMLSELGLLGKGEKLTATTKAGPAAKALAYSCKHGCAASVEAESEGD